MRFTTSSLKTKLLIGVMVIIVPIMIFIIYSNYYAISVVKTKAAETKNAMLSSYVAQIDKTLKESENYLYKLPEDDPSLTELTVFPKESDEYALARIQLNNKLNQDIGFYYMIDSFFAIRLDDNDLLFSVYLP